MRSAVRSIKMLRFPLLVFAAGVLFALSVGGLQQAFIVAVLAVFEVTMSFNNAVINSTVLRRMTKFWQQMFLTVGVFIAVFGVRLLLPVLLVSVSAGLSFQAVIDLALHHPEIYAEKLNLAHPTIAAYGAAFLMMLFLDFVIDEGKEVHWLNVIEKPLARAGRLKPLSTLITLVLVWVASATLAGPDAHQVLVAGLAGLGTYLVVRTLSTMTMKIGGGNLMKPVGIAAFMLFLYLEVLDASFSFDGVVGAFAISNNVITIMLGLGIGALFVRELTVWLVGNDTVKDFIYLEHGAQYSVGALAILLALGLAYDIPDAVTGLVGVVIIGWSLFSSVAARKRA